jgi:hypothetical protein
MILSPSCSGISFDKGGSFLESSDDFSLKSSTCHLREIESIHKPKERNDHHDENNNEMIVKCIQLKNTSHFDKPIENIDRVFIKGISIKSIKFSCKICSQIAEIEGQNVSNFSQQDYRITNSKMIIGKKSNYSLTTIVESDDELAFQNVLNKGNSNNFNLPCLIREIEKNLENNKLHQCIAPSLTVEKVTDTGLNELSTKCELTKKEIDLNTSIDCHRIETSSLTSNKSNETLSQLSLKHFDNYEARSGNSYCSNIFADPKKETKYTRHSLNDHFPTNIDN